MGKDDLFRRSFEAGTAFLEMTRERAEAMVKDLVKAGEVSKGKAQKLVDEVLERSRKGTEELRELIRRELAEQVSTLGLATKDDIERIQGRLDAMESAGPSAPGSPPVAAPAEPPPSAAGPAATPTSTKGAPVKKSAPRRERPAKAASKGASKAPTPRKGAATPSDPGSVPERGAGSGTPTGGPPANGPAQG